MKKVLLILGMAALWFVACVQLNYEQALNKAQAVATDGEIMAAMAEHGFELDDPFQRIGAADKVAAFINVIDDEN